MRAEPKNTTVSHTCPRRKRRRGPRYSARMRSGRPSSLSTNVGSSYASGASGRGRLSLDMPLMVTRRRSHQRLRDRALAHAPNAPVEQEVMQVEERRDRCAHHEDLLVAEPAVEKLERPGIDHQPEEQRRDHVPGEPAPPGRWLPVARVPAGEGEVLQRMEDRDQPDVQ